MKSLRITFITIFVSALYLIAGISFASELSSVTIDELYRKPEKYDGKVVTIEGRYHNGLFDGTAMLDVESIYLHSPDQQPGPSNAVGLAIKSNKDRAKHFELLNKVVLMKGKFTLKKRPVFSGGWSTKGDLSEITDFKEKEGANPPVSLSKEVEEKRKQTLERLRAYEVIENECNEYLGKHRTDFESCYQKHGTSTKGDPFSHGVFSELVVSKAGIIKKIIFSTNEKSKTKDCLSKVIEGFKFSPFTIHKTMSLRTHQGLQCGADEENALYFKK